MDWDIRNGYIKWWFKWVSDASGDHWNHHKVLCKHIEVTMRLNNIVTFSIDNSKCCKYTATNEKKDIYTVKRQICSE